jgi:hypothetical protein
MRNLLNPIGLAARLRLRAGLLYGIVNLLMAALLLIWAPRAVAELPGEFVSGRTDVGESVLRSEPLRFGDLLPERLDRQTLKNPGGPLYAANEFDEFDIYDADKVSVTKATLFSFVLPGAGQWYAGERNRAGIFLASEGIAWAAYGYFETVGAIKRSDYETYARVNAGIDPTGKDDDFYRILSFYDSREEYNSAGRIIDPSRPYYSDVSYWDWQWSSAAALEAYRSLRNQKSEAFNRSKFTLGALVLNRLVSAVDAWRTAKSVNRRARMEQASWKFRIKGKPFGDNPKVMLTYGTRF